MLIYFLCIYCIVINFPAFYVDYAYGDEIGRGTCAGNTSILVRNKSAAVMKCHWTEALMLKLKNEIIRIFLSLPRLLSMKADED